MATHLLIDSHEDLAYESLFGGFDYSRSVADNRKFNRGTEDFQSMVGWPELQEAGAALIFGTVFISPDIPGDTQHTYGETMWKTRDDFHHAVLAQLDFYDRLVQEHADQYRRIFTRADYDEVMKNAADGEHPIGLVTLLEGCEGLRSWEDLELYRERGVRLIGPVWGGGRWCAGTRTKAVEMKDALTDDGRELLRRMSALGYVLDISHMKNHSALDALNAYDGVVCATHANCDALMEGMPYERLLKDETIRELIARDGVMGVIPYNTFLNVDWKKRKLPREAVTLNDLANHIDRICQIAGDSRHAAIGSDADGGFGYPDIPLEMNDMSDLPKLADVLADRGFSEADIENVFHANWQRILERTLK